MDHINDAAVTAAVLGEHLLALVEAVGVAATVRALGDVVHALDSEQAAATAFALDMIANDWEAAGL